MRVHSGPRRFMVAAVLLALAGVVLALAPGAASANPGCTIEQAQHLVDVGRYKRAVQEFTCVIDGDPTEVDGYRGRIEAELMLGLYSDALGDYARVIGNVLPVHPDAVDTVLDQYAARLASAPEDVPALTGASFARWWLYDFKSATPLLDQLLDVQPGDLYGTLFRGSNRLFLGKHVDEGVADLEQAIALAPGSAHVRLIVADAYTYALPDPQRAFEEASLALDWGLDTPRIHAILANSYHAFGDLMAGATHIQRHIDLVTTELVSTAPIGVGTALPLDLVPGRTYEVPVAAAAGQPISITTSSPSKEIFDSIMVLLAPDGSPVVGNDDDVDFYAAFEWVPPVSATYRLQVTSFEGVGTGELVVTRD